MKKSQSVGPRVPASKGTGKASSKVNPVGIGGLSVARGPNGETGEVPESVPTKGAVIESPKGKMGSWTGSQKF